MVGDIDNSGSLNAQVIHQVSEKLRSKLAFQVTLMIFWFICVQSATTPRLSMVKTTKQKNLKSW